MARIRIGTCSWSDRDLIASRAFYPAEVRTPEQRLRYYATRFPLVEVDTTYYGVPERSTSIQWVERTPDQFLFDVKAFRLFTGHQTPLRYLPKEIASELPGGRPGNWYYQEMPLEQREELWRRFLGALAPLRAAGKLGVVLLQFPPWFLPNRRNREQILDCRQHLEGMRVAVEFRAREWVVGENLERTLGFLEEHGLAYVAVDEPQGFRTSLPPLNAVTAEVGLVRFHGRNAAMWETRTSTSAERFDYWYSEAEYEEWVPRLREMQDRALELHLLMNTNQSNQATANAERLQTVLSREGLL